MLPHSSTTISILRSDAAAGTDGYPDSEPSWSVVSSAIPAHISSPGGSTRRDGSVQERMGFTLQAEPCPLRHSDQVLDEVEQVLYRVEWVAQRHGFGLDHTSAGLSVVAGYL